MVEHCVSSDWNVSGRLVRNVCWIVVNKEIEEVKECVKEVHLQSVCVWDVCCRRRDCSVARHCVRRSRAEPKIRSKDTRGGITVACQIKCEMT